jgi:hypothetical protein
MGYRHMIDDLCFETRFDRVDAARAPWAHWPDFCRHRLLAVIDQVFDEFSPAHGPLHRLDLLEVDLGRLPDTLPAEEIEDRLKEALRQQLRDCFAGEASVTDSDAGAPMQTTVRTTARAVTRQETLEHYLRNGLLPGNADASRPYPLASELVRRAGQDPAGIRALLLEAEPALERTLRQLDDPALEQLLLLLAAGAGRSPDMAPPNAAPTRARRQSGPAGDTEERYAAWEEAFLRVLTPGQGRTTGDAQPVRATMAPSTPIGTGPSLAGDGSANDDADAVRAAPARESAPTGQAAEPGPRRATTKPISAASRATPATAGRPHLPTQPPIGHASHDAVGLDAQVTPLSPAPDSRPTVAGQAPAGTQTDAAPRRSAPTRDEVPNTGGLIAVIKTNDGPTPAALPNPVQEPQAPAPQTKTGPRQNAAPQIGDGTPETMARGRETLGGGEPARGARRAEPRLPAQKSDGRVPVATLPADAGRDDIPAPLETLPPPAASGDVPTVPATPTPQRGPTTAEEQEPGWPGRQPSGQQPLVRTPADAQGGHLPESLRNMARTASPPLSVPSRRPPETIPAPGTATGRHPQEHAAGPASDDGSADQTAGNKPLAASAPAPLSTAEASAGGGASMALPADNQIPPTRAPAATLAPPGHPASRRHEAAESGTATPTPASPDGGLPATGTEEVEAPVRGGDTSGAASAAGASQTDAKRHSSAARLSLPEGADSLVSGGDSTTEPQAHNPLSASDPRPVPAPAAKGQNDEHEPTTPTMRADLPNAGPPASVTVSPDRASLLHSDTARQPPLAATPASPDGGAAARTTATDAHSPMALSPVSVARKEGANTLAGIEEQKPRAVGAPGFEAGTTTNAHESTNPSAGRDASPGNTSAYRSVPPQRVPPFRCEPTTANAAIPNAESPGTSAHGGDPATKAGAHEQPATNTPSPPPEPAAEVAPGWRSSTVQYTNVHAPDTDSPTAAATHTGQTSPLRDNAAVAIDAPVGSGKGTDAPVHNRDTVDLTPVTETPTAAPPLSGSPKAGLPPFASGAQDGTRESENHEGEGILLTGDRRTPESPRSTTTEGKSPAGAGTGGAQAVSATSPAATNDTKEADAPARSRDAAASTPTETPTDVLPRSLPSDESPKTGLPLYSSSHLPLLPGGEGVLQSGDHRIPESLRPTATEGEPPACAGTAWPRAVSAPSPAATSGTRETDAPTRKRNAAASTPTTEMPAGPLPRALTPSESPKTGLPLYSPSPLLPEGGDVFQRQAGTGPTPMTETQTGMPPDESPKADSRPVARREKDGMRESATHDPRPTLAPEGEGVLPRQAGTGPTPRAETQTGMSPDESPEAGSRPVVRREKDGMRESATHDPRPTPAPEGEGVLPRPAGTNSASRTEEQANISPQGGMSPTTDMRPISTGGKDEMGEAGTHDQPLQQPAGSRLPLESVMPPASDDGIDARRGWTAAPLPDRFAGIHPPEAAEAPPSSSGTPPDDTASAAPATAAAGPTGFRDIVPEPPGKSEVQHWRGQVMARVTGQFAAAIERHAVQAVDRARYYRRLLTALAEDGPIDPAAIAAQSGEQADDAAALPAAPDIPALPEPAWVEQLLALDSSALSLVVAPLLSEAASVMAHWPEALLERVFARLRPAEFATLHPYAEAMTAACVWDETRARRRRMWRFLAATLFPVPSHGAAPDFVAAYADRLAAEAPVPGDVRAQLCAALPEGPEGGRTAQYIRYWLLGRHASPPPAVQAAAPAAALDGLAVHNAGQVLLSPYLPRLFDMLGLLEDGRFATPAQARRACHLLQFMVDERSDAPEHDLALNKLLCGLDLRQPLDAGITIEERERTAIEGMLAAVIDHWGAIGSASVAGLRETFLQRPGLLAFTDKSWRLKVEKKTLDILMERLPWGFSVIRHPWMTQPLMVDWL